MALPPCSKELCCEGRRESSIQVSCQRWQLRKMSSFNEISFLEYKPTGNIKSHFPSPRDPAGNHYKAESSQPPLKQGAFSVIAENNRTNGYQISSQLYSAKANHCFLTRMETQKPARRVSKGEIAYVFCQGLQVGDKIS